MRNRLHAVLFQGRRDLIAVSLLLLLVLLLLLPALARRAPILRGDGLNEVFPQLLAVARSLQSGGLPLWNPYTFAGARPFYADDIALLFYPPMLPFYLLADTADPVQSVQTLVALPYALHVAWACVGAYLFGRLVLSLRPAGAFVVGLLWCLSPDMTDYLEQVPDPMLFSYVPWAMLAAARYMATGRLRWWTAGVLVLATMGLIGSPHYLVRIYFATAMTVTMLWIFGLRARTGQHAETGGGDGLVQRFRVLAQGVDWRSGRFLAAAGMFVLAIGLAGFAWAGIFEAAAWVSSGRKMTHALAAGLDPRSSTHPLYLATLFVPDLFGVVDTRHAWGAPFAHGMQSSSSFTGGLCVMTAVLAAALYWIPRKARSASERVLRTWTWIAVLSFVFFAFAVFGRHTPVFRWMCAVLPWFFRFPNAVYYRFACCWSLAILAGIGVHGLLAMPEFRQRMGRWPIVGICVGLAAAGIVTALLWRAGLERGAGGVAGVPGHRTLTVFNEWDWFWTGPFLYFAAMSLALLAGFLALRRQWRPRLLLAGVIVEGLALGVLFLYVSLSGDVTRRPPDYASDPENERFMRLTDYWPYQFTSRVQGHCGDRAIRWCSLYGQPDNQAWALDGRSLLGYSGKPLLPRFERSIKPFTRAILFSPTIYRLPLQFLRNMNVGVLAPWFLTDPIPLPILDEVDRHPIYAVTNVLPYVYTQNRVLPLPAEQQRTRLVTSDLRTGVCVDPELLVQMPQIASAVADAGDVALFERLQKRNPILRLDRSLANRTSIDVKTEVAAMLVIAECWHAGWTAEVNGRPAPVARVNYLQQGVWLEPGRHTVELSFFPPSMKVGLAVSAAAWVVLLGAVVVVRRRRREKR